MPAWDAKVKVLGFILALVSLAAPTIYIIYNMMAPTLRYMELQRYEWNFKINELLGWTIIQGFSSAQLTEEGLTIRVVGFDPYIHSPRVRILAEKQFKITVAMRIIGNASTLKLYWVTDRSPNWAEDKTMEIPIEADGKFHEYVLDVENHPLWKGIVTMFRFDLEPPDCYDTQLSIRYVKVPILGPEFRIKGPYLSTPIPVLNKRFEIKVQIYNTGGERLNLKLRLKVNPPIELQEKETIEVNGLEIRAEQSVSWSLIAAKAGFYDAEIKVFSDSSENLIYIVKFPVFPEIRVENEIPVGVPEGITLAANGSFMIKARETLVYFYNNSFGYGPVVILLKSREMWEPVGAFGSFASLTLIKEEEFKERTYIIPCKAYFNNSENSITFKYEEDNNWSFSSKWKVENQSIKANNNLEALKEVNVTQFSVALYPGEMGFTSSKDEALLPGVEWLVSGERSSNTLDIVSPLNIRNSPHPLKVTIPLMALRCSDILVAMLWDPHHFWDEAHGYLSLQFASPNWVESQNNHLFMLFVPTVPRWVRENDEEAYKPYQLKGGKHLSISFRVYSARSNTVLDAVKEWVRIFGLPEPNFPRELGEELRLSMEAYLKSLWVPGQGWRHASGWTPNPFPGYALLLWLTSLIEKDTVLKANLIDRFNESVKLALDTRGSGYIASGEGTHIPG